MDEGLSAIAFFTELPMVHHPNILAHGMGIKEAAGDTDGHIHFVATTKEKRCLKETLIFL